MRTILLVISMLVVGTSVPLGVSAQSSSYGSVQIIPSYQEVSAGSQVSFTVSASSSAGGGVSVAIQPGLTLAGDPSCNGPCPGFDIRRKTDGTFFNVNVYGAVTIQLTLTVSPSARDGDQFAINATLVGGARTVEMSSAVVHVIESAALTATPATLPDPNRSGGGESEPRNPSSPNGSGTDPHATPGDSATHLSILESQGKWDALYDEMHPDAQAIIPRSAVVGWYANEYGPLGPGHITVTKVAYVSWTWEVTGKTYPETAEISFTQPFANGDVVTDVVRLVWTGERWSWFFGRNMEFVQEQIAKYGS